MPIHLESTNEQFTLDSYLYWFKQVPSGYWKKSPQCHQQVTIICLQANYGLKTIRN